MIANAGVFDTTHRDEAIANVPKLSISYLLSPKYLPTIPITDRVKPNMKMIQPIRNSIMLS